MTRQEFQTFHNFTDDEMDFICLAKTIMNGNIVSIKSKLVKVVARGE